MTPPVGPDEILYRQLGPKGDPLFYEEGRTPLVHNRAFIPNKTDTDGLSIIRSLYRSEIWACYRIEKPETRFRLACLACSMMAEISAFSYDVTQDKIDELHGEPFAHCVISEINANDYYGGDDSLKMRIKEWAEQFSRRIQQAHIRGPSSRAPTNQDPIRP